MRRALPRTRISPPPQRRMPLLHTSPHHLLNQPLPQPTLLSSLPARHLRLEPWRSEDVLDCVVRLDAPGHADERVVLQVRADVGEVEDDRDVVRAEVCARADAGEEEDVRGADCAEGEDDLLTCAYGMP